MLIYFGISIWIHISLLPIHFPWVFISLSSKIDGNESHYPHPSRRHCIFVEKIPSQLCPSKGQTRIPTVRKNQILRVARHVTNNIQGIILFKNQEFKSKYALICWMVSNTSRNLKPKTMDPTILDKGYRPSRLTLSQGN